MMRHGQARLWPSSVMTESERRPAISSVSRRFAESRPLQRIAGFMRLSLVDRYLISEVLWRLGAAIAIITCGVMLERMLSMIDLLVNRGIPLRPVASMLLDLLPYYFVQTLPAAFLVAVVFAVARLREEGAMDAILSSGIGIHRLLRPLAALSAVLLIISVIVAGWLDPYGRYAYHRTIYELTHQLWLANAAPGEFVTGLDGKVIRFQSADETRTLLSGVFIHEGNSPGTTTDQGNAFVTTTAKTGKLIREGGDSVLNLYDGLQVRRDASSATPVNIVKFKTLEMRLAPTHDVEAFDLRGKSEGELTFDELWRRTSGTKDKQAAAEAAAELNARLARAAAFVFLPFLALALGSFWRRGRAAHGGLIAGLVLYIAYDHMMNFVGAVVACTQSVPAIVFWLVPSAFTLLSVWLFWLVAFRLAGNPLSATLESIAGALRIRSETATQQPFRPAARDVDRLQSPVCERAAR
jgi:lipopolysaccharide export system permease protein